MTAAFVCKKKKSKNSEWILLKLIGNVNNGPMDRFLVIFQILEDQGGFNYKATYYVLRLPTSALYYRC